jgi:hypothetical protein
VTACGRFACRSPTIVALLAGDCAHFSVVQIDDAIEQVKTSLDARPSAKTYRRSDPTHTGMGAIAYKFLLEKGTVTIQELGEFLETKGYRASSANSLLPLFGHFGYVEKVAYRTFQITDRRPGERA